MSDVPLLVYVSDPVASFLSTVAGGIRVVMTRTYLADEFGEGHHDADGRGAVYIRERLLYEAHSMVGESRFWFSETAFADLLGDEDERAFIGEAILALEDHDVDLEACVIEASVDEHDFEAIAVPVYRRVVATPGIRFSDLLTFDV